MSENLFEPLVDSMVETSKVLIKYINKVLGLNTLDFKQLFKELGLCNKSEQYPKLYNIINTSHFKTYQFTVPIGLSVEDFKKHTEAIEQFMQVDNVSIVIFLNTANSSVDLNKVYKACFSSLRLAYKSIPYSFFSLK